MTRTAMFDADTQRAIKARLWEGESTVNLSIELGVSQATISNIKTGRQYFDAKWPDGTEGGMPEYRRLQLMKGRQRDTRVQRRLGGSNQAADPELVANFMKNCGQGFDTIDDWIAEAKIKAGEVRLARAMEAHNKYIAEYNERVKDRVYPPVEPRKVYVDNGTTDPDKQIKVPWDRVLVIASDLPIVQVADQGDDQDLRDAIATVLNLLPPSYWHMPQFLEQVAKVKARFVAFHELSELT